MGETVVRAASYWGGRWGQGKAWHRVGEPKEVYPGSEPGRFYPATGCGLPARPASDHRARDEAWSGAECRRCFPKGAAHE